ncbi:hypothetical protein BWP20_06625 [Mycobacterium tuberculosis]|nr:hypothetical protein BWP20_06625 [Mycobacterium tuberculosis]
MTAARTRSRDSCNAASGRPTRCTPGNPEVMSASISTISPSSPRTGDGYGGLAHAVTERKVRRLRRLAGLWLADQEERWAAVRIDVIGVRVGPKNSGRTPELTHLQGIG